jgi:hypothetical protein
MTAAKCSWRYGHFSMWKRGQNDRRQATSQFLGVLQKVTAKKISAP